MEDKSAIRSVNELAFGRSDEADLMEGLRHEAAVLLSLLAKVRGAIVGHILFSRMWIDNASGSIAAVALAPISVLLAHQRQGIGRQLIRSGLDSLRDCGERIVLVLGHPDYHQRFGFSTLKARRLANPFPPGTFMAAELGPNALCDLSGKVRYAAAFGL